MVFPLHACYDRPSQPIAQLISYKPHPRTIGLQTDV